jgi:hypothetical protein
VGRSAATSSRAPATSSTEAAVFVQPAAALPLSHGPEADIDNTLEGGRRFKGSVRIKRNEGTQTTKLQLKHESAPASLLRSHLSFYTGSTSPSAYRTLTVTNNAPASVSAVDHSSRATSTQRDAGGSSGGGSSSFDTSATQGRGGKGDSSSSDLSMSPPPPPLSFDFVVKNAKGEWKNRGLWVWLVESI